MKELRTRVRGVLLAFTGVLVVLVLIRFLLLLFGANADQPIVNFILTLSSPLVEPFREFNNFFASSTVEAASITALMVIIVGGLLVTDIVTAFIHDEISEIVLNVVDAVFKFVEAALIIRIVLRLFGVPASAGWFISNIYAVTGWASGVFPEIRVYNGALEVSTIAVLIIVAVIDFATEGVITSLRNRAREAAASKPAPVTPAPAAATIVKPSTPVQHITINVPAPQVPQPRVDKQVINVQAAPQKS